MNHHSNPRSRKAWRYGTFAVLISLTLGSAAQTSLRWDPPQPSTPSPAAAKPAVVAAVAPVVAKAPEHPLPAGFDARHFEGMAQQLVANRRVPGLAMAIVHNGQVISARGYGVTDARAGQPVDSHTVFRLASLSKAFAGTMAGLLVNDGTLRWDSKLVDYMPTFRLSDPYAARQVTVADLLSHRVGLTHNTYDRDLEANVDYRTLTQKLANAPMNCQPGSCYGYQNIAFSLIGDVVFAATGDFYTQEVQRRIFKPLGMNDASLGLDGIESSPRWARPHVRGRGGWVPLMPKPNYYQVAPAAGVNASASDMAQWLLAHTGHRPDVLPAPLLATLHQPLVNTPSETRGSSWRRQRLNSAGYALGWRVYDYAGHRVVFHGGAVQGYRGLVALLPESDLGIALMWNSESSLPSGMLPTILDRALGLPTQRWLDVDFDDTTLYAESGAAPAVNVGASAARATASPQ
ncbi:serine hydrolase domain-containing protein [Lysobacter niastensis]|uniref:Beta-lactamase family protein n=1 Tax=Lysobacter niastensis TaxID=380629 RepID=A0ABS0B229_9GAMM|nr:serine hydrolase domain-containing protein [Lysobacter niastensis]MBF6022541.1 beta-lactamase family protein [Lysobacter niastensis]